MPGQWSTYTPVLASPQGGDFFLGVDGSDHTMAATGTNKDVLFEDLGAAIQGLKFMTGTGALGSTAGTITATDIANAVSAGYQGMWLDSRFVWDLSTLVIENVSNFTIASAMVGSIGWSGLTTYRSTGYCITDTGSPADGVQIWADNTHNTQGIRLKGLAFVGTNSRAVVHIGGKARRVTMDDCFVYNTNVAGTTVASGAGTAIGSVTTLTVAASSTTAFASSGALVVTTVIGAPTPAVPASTVGYTSTLNQAIQVVITGGTMTNVTINGSTVGSGAGTYTLPALGTITMTYTVAPTWAWSSLGLGVLAYTGKTTGTFTGCTLISGVGSLSTLTGMNMVNQAAFGLLDDTSLTVTSPSNSEKNTFKGCDFAALNGVPIGIDVWGISQHANDSIWIDIQTAVGAAGLVSIIATGGGGQQWYNAYDRSGPLITIWYNDGGTEHLYGGEEQNGSASGMCYLCKAGTFIINGKTMTQVGASIQAQLQGGKLVYQGRTAMNFSPLINIGSSGALDISDPAGNYTNMIVTGTAGTLWLPSPGGSGNYPGSIKGYTGTVVQSAPTQVATMSTGGAAFGTGTGTGTALSGLTYTTPDDGQLHRVDALLDINVAVALTGGQFSLVCVDPSGSTFKPQLIAAASGTGPTSGGVTRLVGPNTTVSIVLNSAITAGSGTYWGQLWVS